MIKTNMIAYVIGLFVTAAFTPMLIKALKALHASQTEREIMESHIKKQGTPTMGGILLLLGVLVVGLWQGGRDPRIVAILILSVGFGVIGFLDDFLKVVLKRSDGLIAWQKLLLQFLVTGLFAWHLTSVCRISLAMKIPFWGGHYLDLGWFNYVVLFFAVLGTVNGVNFTDGLDGLVSSVTLVVAVFFLCVAASGQSLAACIPSAVMGALIGFLIYNHHPAKIFMGDTGSLFLGGFVAAMAYAYQMPLFILLTGIIYLVEVVSVILQVGSFKLRHGKRIFKMAPIHHHFELSGWSETKVVVVFSLVTLAGTLLAFVGYRPWVG